MNYELKETIQKTIYIAVLTLVIISFFLFPRYFVKEGKIVEYRIFSKTNEIIGTYPAIEEVIENGCDNYIYLPKHTFEQAIQLKDSLNKQLRNDKFK